MPLIGLVKYVAPDNSHGFLLEIQPKDLSNPSSQILGSKEGVKFHPVKNQECTKGDILFFDQATHNSGVKLVRNISRSIFGFAFESTPGTFVILSEIGNIEDPNASTSLPEGVFVKLSLHLDKTGLRITARSLENESVPNKCLFNISVQSFKNADKLSTTFISFFEHNILTCDEIFLQKLAQELLNIPSVSKLKSLSCILKNPRLNAALKDFLEKKVVRSIPEEIIPLYAEGLIESVEVENWLIENPNLALGQMGKEFEHLLNRLSTSTHFTKILLGMLQVAEDNLGNERALILLKLLSDNWRDLSSEQWLNAFLDVSQILPDKLLENLWEINEQTATQIISGIPINGFADFTKNTPASRISKALWNKKWVIELEHLPICVLDIELRSGKLLELAWCLNDEEFIFKGEENILKQGLPCFQHLLETNPEIIIAGHNIRQFDILEIQRHIEFPNEVQIFDTLEIEAVCSPSRRSYQLRTKHDAISDALLTRQLLQTQINRLRGLDKNIWVEFRQTLPNTISNLIDAFKESVSYIDYSEHIFFQEESESQSITDLINRLSTFSSDTQMHILTPVENQGMLSRLPNLIFQSPTNYIENGFLIPDKINAALQDEHVLRAALLQFVFQLEQSGNLPLVRLLSPWLRIQIAEKLLDPLCLTETVNPAIWKGFICWEPLEFLEKELDAEVVIALLPDLFSLAGKKLLAKLPSDQHEAVSRLYWMRFAGNNGRAPLEKSDAISLAKIQIGSDFDIFWLERSDAANEILLWGNLSAKSWKQFFERKNIQLLTDLKTESAFGVVTVPDNFLNRASIDRLNPDSPYRAPYWLLQTRLLDALVSEERKPVVLVLKEPHERERFATWIRSQGWYVPDHKLSLFRQLELLHGSFSKRRILLTTLNILPSLLQSNYLAPVLVALDSLDLRPWQSSSDEKSTPFVNSNSLTDETDSEDDIKNDQESNDEGDPQFERNDLHSMIQQFYPWMDWMGKMVSSCGKKNALVFLDARLSDHAFPKNFRPVITYGSLPWRNQEAYLLDLENILPYIPQVQPEEESEIFDNCKIAIEAALLGGNHLYDYQENYLRSIAPRRENLVISLPTGGGKSVLFQGPALYRSSFSNRLTLVVTPLKALMEDQVEGLWRKKFWACVDAISGDMTQEEVRHVLRRVAGGEVLLLYLTPERFRSRSFIRSFTTRLVYDKDLEYCVFDEAHCISQWGNEFRPAYLSAAHTVRHWQIGRQLPCLFLSATISEQVFRDIQHIFNGQPDPSDKLRITRLQHQEFYNPIRDHIKLTFRKAKPEDRIETIARFLTENNFNPDLSRVLVFINSRRESEELTQAFEEHVKGKIRAGYFHAGMSSGDREETFDAFKSGHIALLFATKAFGMGMDVPNIHFVFHYEPSSTIEDFLQEVGRAGRDPQSLATVNFSKENPLSTVCLYESDDFGKLFDRIQRSSIAWEDIRELQKLLLDFFHRIQHPADRPAPVSVRLLSQSPTLKDHKQKSTLISIGMHWLEKLGRFKVGMYTPDALEFDATRLSPPITGDPDLDHLLAFLNDLKAQNTDCTSVLAGALDVARILKVQPGDMTEFFRLIFHAQKQGHLYLKNDLSIDFVKGKGDFRIREIISWINTRSSLPELEAAFSIQENVLSIMRPQSALILSGEEVDQIVMQVLSDKIRASIYTWIEPDKRENFAEASRKQFLKNRVKYAVSIFAWFDKVKHRSRMKDGQTIQTFTLDRTEKDSLIRDFETFQQQCRSLLRLIYKGFQEGKSLFDWHKLLDELKIEDIGRLEMLLIFLKRLGYVRFEGSTMPFAIEVCPTETSKEPIDHRNPQSSDCRVYEDEFLENQKLRILRLAALQTLAHLTEEQGREGADRFIQRYFTCQSAADVIDLLEEYLHEGHPVLLAIKEEALQSEETRLHSSQRKVYEADLQRNLNVIAGPGSGKTHTLVLRVARLIHRERVAPGQILVLAYNRAVITELKDRLAKLFARLGYKNLVKGLRVFTFHGLMKYCLQDRADGIEPNDYASLFVRTYDNSPGEIRSRLGNIRFVMVDEFQDITSERLAVLHRIAPPQSVTVTVIGDPDQSIYGYERANLGKPVPPKPYYEKFTELYNPDILELNVNYRSYPNIVNEAKRLLALNPEDFFVPLLDFFQVAPEDWPLSSHYVEIFDAPNAPWDRKLLDLLAELDDKGKPYSQIALMFRTNNEVFRAYAKMNQLSLPGGVRIRIQGSSANFNRLREVHEFLQWIKPCLNEPLPEDFLKRFRSEYWIKYVHAAWDKFTMHTLEALLIEFFQKEKQETSSYSDLAQFIDEFAWRDDGQLNKIYQVHREEIATYHADVATTEIILTTIHRVKGLEYDAVLIPPSYHDLSITPHGNMPFEDMLHEERRLWYVAMTRAKKRLVWIKWQREEALLNGEEFSLPLELRQQIGVGMEDGIDKINIGFLPWLDDESFLAKNTYIEKNIRIGDAIRLMPTSTGGTSIRHNTQLIGMLSKGTLTCPPNGLSGYIVTNVLRYTYEDCIGYDLRHPGSSFADNWKAGAKRLGYVSIVDFAGYGR